LSQTPDVPGPDAAPQVSAPDQAEQVETTDAASDDAPAGAAHARTARTKARHRALDVLFEADAKGLIGSGADVLRVLADRRRRTVAQDGLPTYAIDLVQGVADHIEIIDEIIETNAREWTLRRMPAVDRGLLRLGVLEIVFLDGPASCPRTTRRASSRASCRRSRARRPSTATEPSLLSADPAALIRPPALR
jgi:N utilization substance protein B